MRLTLSDSATWQSFMEFLGFPYADPRGLEVNVSGITIHGITTIDTNLKVIWYEDVDQEIHACAYETLFIRVLSTTIPHPCLGFVRVDSDGAHKMDWVNAMMTQAETMTSTNAPPLMHH